ncbi:hypothetical protein TSAR_007415 [Trichomalopsis sarcophagae]|uniref:Choline transporter-like protein n=1 Tax=Trichomalopsis sarcophagae TaxID=543379 RepID=A0A232F693_9HYME|nr:hypothetical protein TSAR_007415 [Trichomalopsis sarcophagae]
MVTSFLHFKADVEIEAPTSNERYGEKLQFDPAGPFEKNRFRTDFCWLIGFLVFLCVWLIVIIYAFSAGDVGKWQGLTDSQGRVCGYDLDVYDRPYLMQYNKEECPNHECLMCVKECPTFSFNYHNHKALVMRMVLANSTINSTAVPTESTTITTSMTSESTTSTNEATMSSSGIETSVASSTVSSLQSETTTESARSRRQVKSKRKYSTSNIHTYLTFQQMKKYMICRPDVKFKESITFEELDYMVKERMCALDYYKSENQEGGLCYAVNETGRDSWRHTLPKISRDIRNTKYSVIGFILLSACMALMSIALMRWYAPAFVCGSIFTVCAVVFYFIYESCIKSAESKTNGVLLALFICVVVLVLIVLVCIYYRKEIYLACQMIRESSKAIMSILSSLGVSFVCFLVYILILTLGVSVYFSLTTIESPDYRVYYAKNATFYDQPEDRMVSYKESCDCPDELGYSDDSTCDPTTFEAECYIKDEDRKCVLSGCYLHSMKSKSAGFLHLLNFLGLFWSYGFVVGYGDMILASAFATWYWTFNKKILSYLTIIEGFWRVSTYHLGTIALGALIIVICTIIRFIIKTTYKGLNKVNKPITALILLNLKCCFDILENFLEFVNRRAYIACAIHGTDFIQSARSAYYLIKRNIARVILVCQVTHWMLFVLILLISSITTRIAVGYYDSRSEDISFISVPAFLVFVGSYLVTRLLLRVVEVAIDTIFHCFLEDTERNDGTNERPYFMSDELTKFLQKK